MQTSEINNDNNSDQKESQININSKNPPTRGNNIINSSKNVRNQTFNEQMNQPNLENYLKRNSPMQSLKTMFNLHLKKDGKSGINNQNNSFYQDFSPNIDNNFLPLTPQILPNDQKLLNQKYFPSKINVCKGNPDSNPKFIIPSSSPIVQYFASGNVDNILGGDMGFSLENGNSNCFGERISHLSNISQSDMFNCSPSDFFNRTSYGVGSEKNLDGLFMNDNDNGAEDGKYKPPKEDEDELYTVEFQMENLDINMKDDGNSILNKINQMKNKKHKNKMNINNTKNHLNTQKNNNHHKIKKRESKNNNEPNKDKKEKDKDKNNNMTPTQNSDNLKKSKNKNINNNKLLNEKNINEHINNNNNGKDNLILNNNINESISSKTKNNDNQSLIEENNHNESSQNMSIEFTKKIEDYFDHFDDHSPLPANPAQEENYDNKKGGNTNNNMINKNINEDNNIINKTNNLNNNNNENKNNFNLNNNEQIDKNKLIISNNIINNNSNKKNMDKNNNLNYINGMNIRCTNLNINNFTNLNNNSHNGNYYDQNQQLLQYLQNKNNNLMINQNPNFIVNDIYNLNNNNIPNINNFNNNYNQNIYNHLQGINMYNMNLMNNQIPMNQMNVNPFYLQNNMTPGYPFFSNNNINNIPNNTNDMMKNKNQNNYISKNNNVNNNRNLMNNSNINKNLMNNNNTNFNLSNNEQKKKKIKRLEISSYIDKPLSYIADNFSIMGKDQGACRHIQKLLNDNPTETINALYIPICKNVLQLINDPFGNYLIQKIITFLNDEQQYEILKIISPNFNDICCNTHGTRVLQKLVEHCKAPKVKKYFFDLLKPLITPLLKNLNGTFVVQKFAEYNSKEYSQEINEIIVENSDKLSTHRHGCCVIQKYLELKDPIMTPNLLNKLIDKSLFLIIDQFGNYVIQTILLMGDKKYGNRLAEKIAENVVYYAKHKYSSNVVEKCFDYCDGIYLQNLMSNVQKKDNLTELILDEHGNYVVQKVLSLSKPNVQKAMLKIIVPLFDKLKNFAYGERVINRLMVSYPIINDKNFYTLDNDI